MAENAVQVKKDVGQQVIDRVNALCEAGFTMPNDYNYVNAIKASMLALQEVKDKDNKPALDVCTPASIQTFLFDMTTKGLDVSKKQIYPIVRGNKLCGHVSYFGHILQVKRLYPEWTPIAHTIREGDVFEYAIDPETGKMKLVKHEQKLENLDNEFIGAYVYLPCDDGTQELYVMTRKQILKAWSKSSSKTLQTHKDFDDKMAIRTVINSGCTKVINATVPKTLIHDEEEDDLPTDIANTEPTEEDFANFEEVNEKQPTEGTQTMENEVKAETKENDDEF